MHIARVLSMLPPGPLSDYCCGDGIVSALATMMGWRADFGVDIRPQPMAAGVFARAVEVADVEDPKAWHAFPPNEASETAVFTEALEHMAFHPLPTLRRITSRSDSLLLTTPNAPCFDEPGIHMGKPVSALPRRAARSVRPPLRVPGEVMGPGDHGEHTRFYTAEEVANLLLMAKMGEWEDVGVWMIVGGRWLLAVAGAAYAPVHECYEKELKAGVPNDFMLAKAW
jgi:hypothetical protein